MLAGRLISWVITGITDFYSFLLSAAELAGISQGEGFLHLTPL
jgi:hypothetical protein